MTRFFNHAYYLVCLIAAAVAAGWIKAHWNLFENPDGTPASTAYVPKEKL